MMKPEVFMIEKVCEFEDNKQPLADPLNFSMIPAKLDTQDHQGHQQEDNVIILSSFIEQPAPSKREEPLQKPNDDIESRLNQVLVPQSSNSKKRSRGKGKYSPTKNSSLS